MPKFNAQKCREYRERKRLREGKAKKMAKSGAQRAREFRERERMLKLALSAVSVTMDEGRSAEDTCPSEPGRCPDPNVPWSTDPGHIPHRVLEEQTSDLVEIHEDDSGMKEHCEAEAPSESYCSTVILEPGDFKPSIPPLSSALLHRRRKQQRLSMDSTRRVQPKDEDEFAVMGRNIANKLRKLPLERVPVVEKLITDVIFEAQCGNVSQSSRITFYDMRSASLRHPNMRASPPPRQEGAGQKPEGQTLQGQTLQGQTLQGQTLQGQTLQVQTLQGQTLQGQTLPPNVVFLVPQAEGQKAIPLNVQMVPVPRPEGLNSKPSEQPVEPLVKQEDRSNGPE